MVIFEGAPGRVAVFRDPAVPGNIKPMIRMQPELSFRSHRSVITRMSVSQQANHQFLHTLGGEIFIYTFGDRISQVTVSGLSFGSDCTNAGGSGGVFGVEQLIQWYADNKLSARKSPIRFQIGRTPIRGFVSAMTFDISDAVTWITQFNMSLMVLPS